MKTKIVIGLAVTLIVTSFAAIFIITKLRQDTSTDTSAYTQTQGGYISLDQSTAPQNDNPLNIGSDSATGQAATSLPTPDQFGQYEQHKDAASVMYIETNVGTGAEATAGKQVSVAYRGWLTDGTMFDQSRDGSPFNFTLGAHQVIVGWDQGISGMKVGGKRRLIVPSSVGYGPNGNGPIPGGALLVFDVELMAVE